MSQATEMLVATVCAVAGVAAGLAAVGGLILARGDRPWRRTAPEPVHGAIATLAYRYCPAEMRTRTAIVHGDGTAACLDCGEHIPAGDQ